MDEFICQPNKDDLYQFLQHRYMKGLSLRDFHTLFLTFQGQQNGNNVTLEDLNQKFLVFAMQKKDHVGSKRRFVKSTNHNTLSENVAVFRSDPEASNDTSRGMHLEEPTPMISELTGSSYDNNNLHGIENPYLQPQIKQPLVSYSNGSQQNKMPERDLLNEEKRNHITYMQDKTHSEVGVETTNSTDRSGPDFNLYPSQFALGDKPDFFPDNRTYADQEISLICNSRDRDVTKFPFHDYFQVELSQVIKNIVEIKCESVILPNLNFFEFEPCLFLQIYELDRLYEGSQPFYSKMFAQVMPTAAPVGQRFLTCKTGKSKKKFYTNPLASLSRMTIRLCSSNGIPLPLPTDVFQIVNIENALYENASIYRITTVNQPRNLNKCFYDWLKAACHIFDPIYLTGLPEIRQQLYYLDFEIGEINPECPVVIYASSLKITKRLFSDINFCQLGMTFANCLCSFNKLAVSVQFKIKFADVDTKILHSRIVK